MSPRLEEFLNIINICPEYAKLITASIREKSEKIKNLFNEKRISKETFWKQMASLRAKIAKKLGDDFAALLQEKRNHESTENSERLKILKEAVRKRLKSIIKYLDIELNPSEEKATPNVTRCYSTDEMLSVIHELLLLMEIPFEIAKRLVDELTQVHGDIRTIQSSNAIQDYLIIFDSRVNDVQKITIAQRILEALHKGTSSTDIVLDQQLKMVYYIFFNLVLSLFSNLFLVANIL